MSPSPERTEANRANAQLSTGPRSEAGKSRSRFNALRHGLTSQTACMPWEDRDVFDKFCADIVAELHPEGPIEIQLAHAIAEDHWRLNRARAVEQNYFTLGLIKSGPTKYSDDPATDAALIQAETFFTQANDFVRLTLYEQRINRNLKKNQESLEARQSARREAQAREPQAPSYRMKEPTPAASSTESCETRAVQPLGFVFSSSRTAPSGPAGNSPGALEKAA